MKILKSSLSNIKVSFFLKCMLKFLRAEGNSLSSNITVDDTRCCYMCCYYIYIERVFGVSGGHRNVGK